MVSSLNNNINGTPILNAVRLDDMNTQRTVVAKFLASVMEYPIAYTEQRWSATELNDFLPKLDSFSQVGAFGSNNTYIGYWKNGNSRLLVNWSRGSDGHEYWLTVSADTLKQAQAHTQELLLLLPALEPEAGTIPVTFWSNSPHGPSARVRTLVVPSWADIEGNYASGCRIGLRELLSTNMTGLESGKLCLLHGKPGTGKTYAIRAIGQEWRKWCRIHYIVDPDEFFKEAEYMLSVLLDEGDPETWRMLVVEDSDEFITADAKRRTGQALSRLLNLTDGIIGQGLRVLVLMTTNEPVDKLHPAVSRMGRCIANIEFGELSKDEANMWLSTKGEKRPVNSPSTIADLYQRIGKQGPVIRAVRQQQRVGFMPTSDDGEPIRWGVD